MATGEADDTRERLLRAAGEEFADRGYAEATVRAILKRAGIGNVAAVNYYFGDKENLYAQAVLAAHRDGDGPLSIPADVAPADRLRAFLRHFLTHVLVVDPGGGDWRQRLTLREMIEPSKAIDIVVREAIRPRFTFLRGVLAELCPDAAERKLDALVFSAIGQCLFYKVCRPVADRLVGEDRFASLDVDFLTDHIAGVILAAIGRENVDLSGPKADATPRRKPAPKPKSKGGR